MRRIRFLTGIVLVSFVAATLGTVRAQGPHIEEPITLDFQPGDCLISLPKVISPLLGINDSQALCNEIPHCASVTKLIGDVAQTWDRGTGSCDPATLPCPFPIDTTQGYGYLVNVDTPGGTWEFNGRHRWFKVPLVTGSTYVSLPWRTPLMTAEDVLNTDSRFAAISRLDCQSGAVISFTGFSGTNFDLQPGEGYILSSTASFDWRPPITPATSKKYKITGVGSNSSNTWKIERGGTEICAGNVSFSENDTPEQLVDLIGAAVAPCWPEVVFTNQNLADGFFTLTIATPLQLTAGDCSPIGDADCSFESPTGDPTIKNVPPVLTDAVTFQISGLSSGTTFPWSVGNYTPPCGGTISTLASGDGPGAMAAAFAAAIKFQACGNQGVRASGDTNGRLTLSLAPLRFSIGTCVPVESTECTFNPTIREVSLSGANVPMLPRWAIALLILLLVGVAWHRLFYA